MSQLHQLLNLDPRIERPNAYQIVGLEPLESDQQKVREAIGKRVARLKAAKSKADATAWASAAKYVNQARTILLDAEKKQRYDDRLRSRSDSVTLGSHNDIEPQSASTASTTEQASTNSGREAGTAGRAAPPSHVATPSHAATAGGATAGDTASASASATTEVLDPLDRLLPQGDPFANFDMDAALEYLAVKNEELDSVVVSADASGGAPAAALAQPSPMQSTTHVPSNQPPAVGSIPVPIPSMPSPSNPFAGQDLQSNPAVNLANNLTNNLTNSLPNPSAPAPKIYKRRKAKRGIPVTGIVMTLVIVGLFGGLLYMLNVVMNKQASVGNTQVAAGPGQAASVPAPSSAKPKDPVMGDLLPEGPAPSTEDSEIKMGVLPPEVGNMPAMNSGGSGSGMVGGMSNMTNNNNATPTQPATPPATQPATPPVTPSATTPATPVKPTAQSIADAEKLVEASREAIRKLEWDKMMALAEQSYDASATNEQRQSSAARRRLVHYASEYRDAIDRALDGFSGAEKLEVSPGNAVSIVEVTPTEIVLRLPGRNKSFPRNDLVPTVARSLAKLGLPEDPALLGVFEGAWYCLRPKATPEDREYAIKLWNQFAGQNPDADTSGLEQELKAIFP